MTAAVIPARRSGFTHWWSSYAAMVRWELIRLRLSIAIAILVQSFTGVGLILGFGLLLGDSDIRQLTFLSTGAMVITVITVGLVVGPQMVAQQRLSGQYDYMASLPVPRSAGVAGWVSVTLLVAAPGAVGALLAGMLRYSIDYQISLLLIPALLLVLVSGTLIGYTYAVAIANPRLVSLASQVVIFTIFGFSPIAYPAANLPDWLQTVHRFLPFESMANLIRSGLTDGIVTDTSRSFLVVATWTGLATLLTARVVRRRP